MIALMLEGAEEDLEAAFNYYEVRRQGLGVDLVEEFRRAVTRILEFPGAWQALDETYRRYRLHRFPYGVVYRVDRSAGKAIIVAVAHLSRGPGWWRARDRQ
jgi:plasmid stabilization system protein ParE